MPIKLKPLTFKQLQTEMGFALMECKTKEEEIKLLNTPISVYFDYPIFGVREEYSLIKVTDNTKLRLWNPATSR